MIPIAQQKKALRQAIAKLKKEHAKEDKISQSNAIFNTVEKLPEFNKSTVILLYWSMSDEVHTHAFIEKWWQVKTILLPVVDGDQLRIKQYQGLNTMKAGEHFGILEPRGPEFTNLSAIDIILVPGIAFDNSNNRMGRGRGYYDKLLASTKAIKLGLCFDYQMMNSVPIEAHDLKMDRVISA